MSAGRDLVMSIVRAVAPRFFAEGHERVYVAECCKRVLIIPSPVDRCRTCGKTPEGFWVTAADVKA